jgi:DNA-binding CsgD family transcriptional regulator
MRGAAARLPEVVGRVMRDLALPSFDTVITERRFTITYRSAMTSLISHATLLLTPPERAVLQLLADGRPNHEIADRLSVGEHDVDAHLTRLFEKMGASSRHHAIDVALRRGLVIERLS